MSIYQFGSKNRATEQETAKKPDSTFQSLASLDHLANRGATAARKGDAVPVLERSASDLDQWAVKLGHREGLALKNSAVKGKPCKQ